MVTGKNLEIKLNSFHQSTIPQKQFINIKCLFLKSSIRRLGKDPVCFCIVSLVAKKNSFYFFFYALTNGFF